MDVGIRYCSDAIPKLFERTLHRLGTARAVGMCAVAQGTAEVRRRLDDDVSDRGAARTRSADTPIPIDAADDEDDVAPSSAELALPDYDSLPAAHIVAKLATLSLAERALIADYERAHRHRRTVLGKIDQLHTT